MPQLHTMNAPPPLPNTGVGQILLQVLLDRYVTQPFKQKGAKEQQVIETQNKLMANPKFMPAAAEEAGIMVGDKKFKLRPQYSVQPQVKTAEGTQYQPVFDTVSGEQTGKLDQGKVYQAPPTTAEGKYLRDNPNASPEQAAQYKRSLAKPQFDLIAPVDKSIKGKQKYLKKGNTIPEGWEVVRPPGVSINMGTAMPSEQITAEVQIRDIQQGLATVKSLHKKSKGNWTGPIQGRYGGFKENWVGLPTEQADFYASVQNVNNMLIYLRSGKQINETEYKRLVKEMPGATLPDSVFKARLGRFERELNTIIETRQGEYRKAGYRGYQPEGVSTPQKRPLPTF